MAFFNECYVHSSKLLFIWIKFNWKFVDRTFVDYASVLKKSRLSFNQIKLVFKLFFYLGVLGEKKEKIYLFERQNLLSIF